MTSENSAKILKKKHVLKTHLIHRFSWYSLKSMLGIWESILDLWESFLALKGKCKLLSFYSMHIRVDYGSLGVNF